MGYVMRLRSEIGLHEFVHVYNLIPTDVCNDVITNNDTLPEWVKHTWYSGGDTTARHDQEPDMLFNHNSSLDEYIVQALDRYHYDLNRQKSIPDNISLVSNYSKIRLNRYKTGSIMSEHFDLIRRGKDDGVPVLSLVGSLNDNYTGGQFMMNDKIIELKQGDILVFPSTFLYPHGVEEVTEGTRYTFVTWAY